MSQAELKAVQAELQGATEMLDSMQQMASSSMEGQEEAQKQMDALTSQLQAAIQVLVSPAFWAILLLSLADLQEGKTSRLASQQQ